MCDTPSHGRDHLWLIWKESIQHCRCYRADTAGGTDGRTDGRTDGVKPIYPPTTSLLGGYNKTLQHTWQIIWKHRLQKWRPYCLGLNVFRHIVDLTDRGTDDGTKSLQYPANGVFKGYQMCHGKEQMGLNQGIRNRLDPFLPAFYPFCTVISPRELFIVQRSLLVKILSAKRGFTACEKDMKSIPPN